MFCMLACLVIIEFEFLKLIGYHDIICYMLCGNLVRLSVILYVLEIVLYPLCLRYIQLQTKLESLMQYISV